MDSSDFLILYAMAYVGKPYRWGGDDPLAGLDCSGFVLELLKSVGVVVGKYDASSQQIYNDFKSLEKEKADFGCLLFFGKSKTEISHITFALNDRLMIEAGGGDSTTTTLDQAIKQNAFVKVRPIASRNNLVAVVEPKYPWR